MAATGDTRTALIAGSTGLVGSELLAFLLADPDTSRVDSLVRRPSGLDRSTLVEHVVDFDALSDVTLARPTDDVYCCLGTTMRAAGSGDAFRRVDHDYVVALGQVAVAVGARSFTVISSVGANPAARSFYLRVKGETERDLQSLGFPRLAILRPSLLLGNRREVRLGERVGEVALRIVSPVLRGSLARYRPVHARTVARAMVGASREDVAGVRVLEYPEIVRLGGEAEG